ncbi:MAG: type II toxin-antitoxin system HicB family antitoxin [bacterium]|nr:type II toxin-antitoxin system HicB family antitoxin [bacterium]
MLREYIDKKLRVARYKLLKDGTYFAEIPGVRGVWANAKNLEQCRRNLRDVLEEWLLLKVSNHESVPGFNLKVDRRNLVLN